MLASMLMPLRRNCRVTIMVFDEDVKYPSSHNQFMDHLERAHSALHFFTLLSVNTQHTYAPKIVRI